MQWPVKVWQDDESWYAEVVTVPQAHAIGDSREEVLENLRHVIDDLRGHGLLRESAELAKLDA